MSTSRMQCLMSSLLAAALMLAVAGSSCDAGDLACDEQALLQRSTEGASKTGPIGARQAGRGMFTLTQGLSRLPRTQRLSGAPATDMQEVLALHNKFRCMHDVPPFTWDQGLAASAQAWADGGMYVHSTTPNGENLHCSEGLPATELVQEWYDEIQYTWGGTVPSFDASTPAGHMTGHYTQVVWKSSTKVGCGMSSQKGNTGCYIWVCHYSPPGNVDGQFAGEVLAPSKSEQDCQTGSEGASGSVAYQDSENTYSQDGGCEDGAPGDFPLITNHDGSQASCHEVKDWCWEPGYEYVRNKCKETCGNC